jgi:hypothetical protein
LPSQVTGPPFISSAKSEWVRCGAHAASARRARPNSARCVANLLDAGVFLVGMVGEGATGSVFFWAITGRWSLIPGQLLRARVRSARHPSPGSPAATLRPWPPPKWSAGRSAVDVRPANVRERPGSESWKRDQPPVDGLGLASWLCHPRAQAVEQNGSPFLTAMSGRSLPQHGQRPSRRGEGSGRIDGWLSNVGRRLSLALADGTVMPPPRWSGRLSRAKCLALQVESCSPRLHRLARVKRVGRLRASAGVLAGRASYPQSTPRAYDCSQPTFTSIAPTSRTAVAISRPISRIASARSFVPGSVRTVRFSRFRISSDLVDGSGG